MFPAKAGMILTLIVVATIAVILGGGFVAGMFAIVIAGLIILN